MLSGRRTVRFILVTALLLPLAGPGSQAGVAGDVRTRSFRLLNQGVTAYKNADYPLAVEKLEEAASMALNNFRVHFYLGISLIGDRRYERAVTILTIALDLDPNHLQSLIGLGDAYLKMGDIDEAEAAFYRGLKLRPEYAPALDGIARVKEAQANDTEAIATFRRAIASNKGYAPAYTHLGDLYLRMNRFEEAVMLLEEAVAIRPDYTPGLNRLAQAYGRLRLDSEAVAAIQAAIELDPKNASHPATLGDLQLTQGFVPAAESSFRTALALDPALPEARLGLAKVARRRGEYAAALEQIEIALADERTDARMISTLEQYRDTLRIEETEIGRLVTLCAETAEPPSEDLEALAMIYARRGRWNDAVELAQRAEPTPERLEKLAYMLFRAGRFGEAHEIYDGLVRQVRRADLEVNNGVTLAMLGDDKGAVRAYRRAAELEPGNDGAALYLGNALLRLGNQPEAVAAYKNFLDRTKRGESAERVRRILRQIAPEALPPPPDATQPGAPRSDPDAEGAPS